jgi:hypothetical protein
MGDNPESVAQFSRHPPGCGGNAVSRATLHVRQTQNDRSASKRTFGRPVSIGLQSRFRSVGLSSSASDLSPSGQALSQDVESIVSA